MPKFAYLNLDSAAYDIFGSIFVSVDLTPREQAIITTMLLELIERDAWEDMTDAEWEVQEQEIQTILDRLIP